MSVANRTWNTALWGLQAVAAGGFLFAALRKFAGVEPAPSTFAAIGLGDWVRYFVGGLEVAGAAALLVPSLTGLAGLVFTGLTAGAAFAQVLVVDGGAATPLALFAVSALVAWGRRENTVRLWARLTHREERPRDRGREAGRRLSEAEPDRGSGVRGRWEVPVHLDRQVTMGHGGHRAGEGDRVARTRGRFQLDVDAPDHGVRPGPVRHIAFHHAHGEEHREKGVARHGGP
ncbi:DoxX family protein [Spongiactinospora sp. 9N601]